MHFINVALVALASVAIAAPADETTDAGPRLSLPKIGGGAKLGGGISFGGRGGDKPKGISLPKFGGNKGGDKPKGISFGGGKPNGGARGGGVFGGGFKGGARPRPSGGHFEGHGHGGNFGGRRWGYGYNGPHYGWDNVVFDPVIVPLPVPGWAPPQYLNDGSSCSTAEPGDCNSGMCCSLNDGSGAFCLTDQDVESGDQCFVFSS
jgi:hypothetical protein